MNMSKKLIIFIFTFFLFNISVKAAAICDTNHNYGCAKCTYSTSAFKFIYYLKSNGNGSAELNFSHEKTLSNSPMIYNFTNSLVSRNFISSENKLSCPKILYIKYQGGASTTVGIDIKDVETNGYVSVNLDYADSFNNDKLVVGENTSISHTCSYKYNYSGNTIKGSISVVNGSLMYEFSDNFKLNTNNNDLTVDDFSNNTCPELFFTCGSYGQDRFCTFVKESSNPTLDKSSGEIEINSNDKSQSKVEQGYDTSIECSVFSEEKTCRFYQHCRWDGSNKKCIDGFVAGDPCNENSIRRVLKIFGIILLVAKIAVPLIIIGIGTFDLFKAVVDKDEKSFGKQIKQLMMRIVAGLIVFFIPSIINAVFSMSDKFGIIEDDKYATCRSCVLDPTNEVACDTE